MKNFIKILVVVILFSAVNIVKAQNDNLKKYQKLLKEKFTEKLNVSDTLADRYFEFFNRTKNEIKKLTKERVELMQYLEDNPESADLGSKIDRLTEIEQQMTSSRKDFITNLKTIFSSQQIAKSIIFQKNLRQFLRKEIKDRKSK